MIWLFCKKTKQNKTQALNLCFPAQKRVPLLFLRSEWKGSKERGEERGGASWARHKRKKKESGGLDSAPHPPEKTQSVWLAAQSPGSKVRGKVSFVPSIPLVLKDTLMHIHTAPQTHASTHMLMHTHTHLYLLEGGSDLSLCARPTRRRCSTLGVFHSVEEPLWKHWLVASRFCSATRLLL